MNAAQEMTVHTLMEDLLAVIRRRKALIAVVALTTLFVVYVGLAFVGDQYAAQTILLVKLGRENAQLPVTVEKGGVYANGVAKEEINSYIALLTSRPLIEAAVQEVGSDRFKSELERPKTLAERIKYPLKVGARWAKKTLNEILILAALRPRLSEHELLMLGLERRLEVYREKDSNAITLRLRLPDPVLARDVLEVLLRRHRERHVEVVRQAPQSVGKFFAEQARMYGERCTELRNKASELKSTLGVSAVGEQRTQRLEMLKTAEVAKQENERELAQLRAQNKVITERRQQIESQILTSRLSNPGVLAKRVKEELAELQQQRAKAKSAYEQSADPVRKLEAQIADLRSLLEKSPAEEDASRTFSLNPIAAQFDAELENAQVRMAVLEALVQKTDDQIALIKQVLQKLDAAETELQRTQLEINISDASYVANASRREEAHVQETMDLQQVTNIAVLSPPSYSEKPVAPKRLLIFGLGLVGGIIAGIGLALLLEWQNDRIHDSRDIERLGEGLYLGSFGAKAG